MPDLTMDFNSRYYLIESVQQVVEVIGSDCIVTGLDVLSTSLSNTGVLTINLSKGKVICDKTLIDFPDNETLELDISSLPLVGNLALSVSFKYLRTSRPNFASFSIKYLQVPVQVGGILIGEPTDTIDIGGNTLSGADNTFICTEWLPERDKIVISQLVYNKSNLNVSKFECTLKEKYSIIINNKLYEIRPFTYVIQQLRPLLALI